MTTKVELEVALNIARQMVRPWRLATIILSILFLSHLLLVYFDRVDIDSTIEAEKLKSTTRVEGIK